MERYNVDFLHGGIYLLELQTDDVILDGCGQACTKRLLKLQDLKNEWRYKVDYAPATSYLLKLQIDHIILDGHG